MIVVYFRNLNLNNKNQNKLNVIHGFNPNLNNLKSIINCDKYNLIYKFKLVWFITQERNSKSK